MAAALAADLDERDRCGGCGHPLSVSTSPDHQNRFEAEAIRCHACKAAADEAGRFDAGNRDGLMLRTWLPGDTS